MNGYNMDIRWVVVGRMSGTTIDILTGDGRVVRVRKTAAPERRARLFEQVFSGHPRGVPVMAIPMTSEGGG
jgi:hypothetical protein